MATKSIPPISLFFILVELINLTMLSQLVFPSLFPKWCQIFYSNPASLWLIENKHNTRINMQSVTRWKFKSPHFLLARIKPLKRCQCIFLWMHHESTFTRVTLSFKIKLYSLDNYPPCAFFDPNFAFPF